MYWTTLHPKKIVSLNYDIVHLMLVVKNFRVIYYLGFIQKFNNKMSNFTYIYESSSTEHYILAT